uniref:BZIP domain-containing protein n=1 Tax=Schistocephalus solidus TaxID=70667 RepID=A0A0V0JBI6_SCHSO
MPDEKSWVQQPAADGPTTKSRPTTLKLATGSNDSSSNLLAIKADFLTPTISQFLQKHAPSNTPGQFISPISADNKLISDILSQSVKNITGETPGTDTDMISLNIAWLNPSSLSGTADNGGQKSFIVFSPSVDVQSQPFAAAAAAAATGSNNPAGASAYLISPTATRQTLFINPQQAPTQDKLPGFYGAVVAAAAAGETPASDLPLKLFDKEAHKLVESQLQEVANSTAAAVPANAALLSDPIQTMVTAFPDEVVNESQRPTRPSSAASSLEKEGKTAANSSSSTLSRRQTTPPALESRNQRLERKRARNRDAARKCRERKINLIKSLEKEVGQLTEENEQLRSKLSQTQADVERLKVFLQNHVESPCPILSQN